MGGIAEAVRRIARPRPAVVAAVGLAAFTACLGYALKRHKWDVSGFVMLGRQMTWADHPVFAAVTRPDPKIGYDGQAYYAIARRPWADHRGEIDFPFRQTRLLYPLACFLLSAGEPHALLWVMPLVNLLLLGALCWGGAAYARRNGVSGWWGLTLPLALNALLPAVRDLTDLTAAAAAFALLFAWEARARAGWLGLLAAATVLAREQNVAVVGAVLLAAVWGRRFPAAVALAAGAAALPAWMLYLRGVYGEWPVMPTDGIISPPLAGVRHWIDWKSHHNGMRAIRWIYAAFMLGQVGVIGWRLVRDRGPTAVTLVGVAGVGLAVLCGPGIYDDYWGYSRALFWIPLAGWMAAVRAGGGPALWLTLLSLPLVHGTLTVM